MNYYKDKMECLYIATLYGSEDYFQFLIKANITTDDLQFPSERKAALDQYCSRLKIDYKELLTYVAKYENHCLLNYVREKFNVEILPKIGLTNLRKVNVQLFDNSLNMDNLIHKIKRVYKTIGIYSGIQFRKDVFLIFPKKRGVTKEKIFEILGI